MKRNEKQSEKANEKKVHMTPDKEWVRASKSSTGMEIEGKKNKRCTQNNEQEKCQATQKNIPTRKIMD